MKRTSVDLLVAIALLAAMALSACGPSGKTTTTSTRTSTGTGSVATSAAAIPLGRSFAEGGGGPKSYTFREEWRHALAVAQQWRKGAFLFTASGQYVNRDGVPNSWTMGFVDAIPTDEILVVDVDPWGAITRKHIVQTAKITDQLQPGDAQIPPEIMDSDTATAKAMATLPAAEPGSNPTLSLAFRRDGSGPWWIYGVHGPGSKYSAVRINALTGEARVIAP